MVTIEDLSAEHLETVARWLSDPAINQWLSGDWRNRQVTPSLLAIALRNKRNRFFLVRSDAVPCGLVALSDIDLDDSTAMVWYALGDSALAGRGITSDAVRQISTYAFTHLKLASVYAWAMEPNVGSQRVLEKSGFQRAGRLRKASNLRGAQLDRLYFDLVPAAS